MHHPVPENPKPDDRSSSRSPDYSDLRWSTNIDHTMRTYFDHRITVFPRTGGLFQPPIRFFQLHVDSIEKSFPSDGDARGLISALATVVSANLWRFLIFKRTVYVTTFLIFLALPTILSQQGFLKPAPVELGKTLPQRWPAFNSVMASDWFAIAFSSLMVLAFFWILNAWLSSQFKQSAENSATRTQVGLVQRFRDLVNSITDAENQIYSSEFEGQKDLWPHRAEWWSTLLIWLCKRVEYIERFLQIEMWQIRRNFFFINMSGLASIVILAVGLTATGSFVSEIQLAPAWYFSFSSIFLLIISFLSFFKWDPSIDIVEHHLGDTQTRVSTNIVDAEGQANTSWRTAFADLKLQDRLGWQFWRVIKKIIEEERRNKKD
jgi:hypothetical protein